MTTGRETKTRSGNGAGLLIVAILAVLFFQSQRSGGDGKPEPKPDNKPSAVSAEIRRALDGTPAGTAVGYAAFYEQCANTLELDSKTTVAKLRERMERAKDLLRLSSPDAFGDVVSRELKDFETGQIDRNKYAEAFRRLANDCRGAQ